MKTSDQLDLARATEASSLNDKNIEFAAFKARMCNPQNAFPPPKSDFRMTDMLRKKGLFIK